MSEELQKLEKELEDLKESNLSSWNTYGSELCAGDMIRQERELEEKINELKEPKFNCGGKDVTYKRLRKKAKELTK